MAHASHGGGVDGFAQRVRDRQPVRARTARQAGARGRPSRVAGAGAAQSPARPLGKTITTAMNSAPMRNSHSSGNFSEKTVLP